MSQKGGVIRGLGAPGDFIAAVPQAGRNRPALTEVEERLLKLVGRASAISDVIHRSGLQEPQAISVLLSLRAKGAIAPARVQPAAPSAPVDAGMSEEVDLEPERKKEILDLERALDAINHFEVLGLRPGATPDEVRRAYHEASRRYHPDRYYGKNLGSFKARIDRIFRRLAEANGVLVDDKKREAYLAANPHLAQAKPAPPMPGGASHAEGPSAPRSPEDQARAAERRARMAKHPYLARGQHVIALKSEGKAALEKEDYGKAVAQLSQAAHLDAKNSGLRDLLDQAKGKHQEVRAVKEMERAKSAEMIGDLAKAAEAYRNAAAFDARNALAAAKAASLGLQSGHEAQEVRAYAQRAVELEPKNPNYRALLGQVLLRAGMKKLAKREFETALELNPHHPEAKAQLRKLRWTF